MFNSVRDIVFEAQRNGFTFDIESGGFYNDRNAPRGPYKQPMYSGSYADHGAKEPITGIFNVSKDVDNFSAFGYKGWNDKDLQAQIKKSGYTNKRDWAEGFVSKLESKTVVEAHNPMFDWGFLSSELDNDHLDRIKAKLVPGQFPMTEETALRNKNNIDYGAGKWGAHLRDHNYDQAYTSYLKYANEASQSGKTVVLDSLSIMKMYGGFAKESGVTQTDFVSGNKLEFLAEALGINTDSLAHKEFDVIFNQPVIDTIGKDIEVLKTGAERVARPGGKPLAKGDLSSGGQRLINMLEYVNNYGPDSKGSPQSLSEFTRHNRIKTAALENTYLGQAVLETKEGRTPTLTGNKSFSIAHIQERYNDSMSIEDVTAEWNKAESGFLQDKAAGKTMRQAEMPLLNAHTEYMTDLKAGIRGLENNIPRSGYHSTAKAPIGDLSFKNIVKNKSAQKFAMYGIAAVAGATLISSLSSGYSAPPPTRISSKDDDYNTIEGLRHGGVAEQMRKRFTDFGSGYQGPNPQINPDYNQAEDVYRYEWMRASKIGLSEEDMYKYMTQEDDEFSEYVSASANAGTALHEYQGAKDAQAGIVTDIEEAVVDRSTGITGHIDVEKFGQVGDYKTVSSGIFDSIRKQGRAKKMHIDQVQFYLGQKGMSKGFIQYIDRGNTNRQKVFNVDFNSRHYERLLGKVERTKARVLSDISSGRLNRRDLPMTASPERLLEAARNRETPEELAQEIDAKRQTFKEEMDYIKTLKRGMPTSGDGYRRVQKRNDMQSTQGIGLQISNNMSQHHVM